MWRAIGVVWVGGCSTEYALQSIEADPAAGYGMMVTPASPGPTDPEPPRERVVEIGAEEPSEIADYLFVIDSSASMTGVLNHVLAGFDAVRDSDVFPRGAQIGVMSTLPADPMRPSRQHPRAKQRWWLQFEPGFQELVDGDAITIFRELAPAHVAERFPIDGCRGWFAPTDVNAKGVPCLVANTQLSLYPVLVEAGLLAVKQRLDRDEPLFRTGAAANVIFVSDTHDPGLSPGEAGFGELVAQRPTFEQLRVSALSRQPLASFRVHAVAPAQVCAEEDWTAAGASYFAAARAAGGEIVDVCTAGPADYVEFVRSMVEGGAKPQAPVIALADGEEVLSVRVDGRPARFSLSDDGRAVTLRQPLSGAATEVHLVLR